MSHGAAGGGGGQAGERLARLATDIDRLSRDLGLEDLHDLIEGLDLNNETDLPVQIANIAMNIERIAVLAKADGPAGSSRKVGFSPQKTRRSRGKATTRHRVHSLTKEEHERKVNEWRNAQISRLKEHLEIKGIGNNLAVRHFFPSHKEECKLVNAYARTLDHSRHDTFLSRKERVERMERGPTEPETDTEGRVRPITMYPDNLDKLVSGKHYPVIDSSPIWDDISDPNTRLNYDDIKRKLLNCRVIGYEEYREEVTRVSALLSIEKEQDTDPDGTVHLVNPATGSDVLIRLQEKGSQPTVESLGFQAPQEARNLDALISTARQMDKEIRDQVIRPSPQRAFERALENGWRGVENPIAAFRSKEKVRFEDENPADTSRSEHRPASATAASEAIAGSAQSPRDEQRREASTLAEKVKNFFGWNQEETTSTKHSETWQHNPVSAAGATAASKTSETTTQPDKATRKPGRTGKATRRANRRTRGSESQSAGNANNGQPVPNPLHDVNAATGVAPAMRPEGSIDDPSGPPPPAQGLENQVDPQEENRSWAEFLSCGLIISNRAARRMAISGASTSGSINGAEGDEANISQLNPLYDSGGSFQPLPARPEPRRNQKCWGLPCCRPRRASELSVVTLNPMSSNYGTAIQGVSWGFAKSRNASISIELEPLWRSAIPNTKVGQLTATMGDGTKKNINQIPNHIKLVTAKLKRGRGYLDANNFGKIRERNVLDYKTGEIKTAEDVNKQPANGVYALIVGRPIYGVVPQIHQGSTTDFRIVNNIDDARVQLADAKSRDEDRTFLESIQDVINKRYETSATIAVADNTYSIFMQLYTAFHDYPALKYYSGGALALAGMLCLLTGEHATIIEPGEEEGAFVANYGWFWDIHACATSFLGLTNAFYGARIQGSDLFGGMRQWITYEQNRGVLFARPEFNATFVNNGELLRPGQLAIGLEQVIGKDGDLMGERDTTLVAPYTQLQNSPYASCDSSSPETPCLEVPSDAEHDTALAKITFVTADGKNKQIDIPSNIRVGITSISDCLRVERRDNNDYYLVLNRDAAECETTFEVNAKLFKNRQDNGLEEGEQLDYDGPIEFHISSAPTPSSSPSVSPTPSNSPSGSASPSVSPSVLPTPSNSPSGSTSPVISVTVTPSSSPTGEPTVSISASPSSSPTPNTSSSASPTGEPTTSASPSSTASQEPTASASTTATTTPTASPAAQGIMIKNGWLTARCANRWVNDSRLDKCMAEDMTIIDSEGPIDITITMSDLDYIQPNSAMTKEFSIVAEGKKLIASAERPTEQEANQLLQKHAQLVGGPSFPCGSDLTKCQVEVKAKDSLGSATKAFTFETSSLINQNQKYRDILNSAVNSYYDHNRRLKKSRRKSVNERFAYLYQSYIDGEKNISPHDVLALANVNPKQLSEENNALRSQIRQSLRQHVSFGHLKDVFANSVDEFFGTKPEQNSGQSSTDLPSLEQKYNGLLDHIALGNRDQARQIAVELLLVSETIDHSTDQKAIVMLNNCRELAGISRINAAQPSPNFLNSALRGASLAAAGNPTAETPKPTPLPPEIARGRMPFFEWLFNPFGTADKEPATPDYDGHS